MAQRIIRTLYLLLLNTSLLPSIIVFAGFIGGVDATPGDYEITVSKIEFRNDSGGWVTFTSGSYIIDIADIVPDTATEQIAAGSSLPADTYTTIRVTFDNDFGLTAEAIDAPHRGRTNTGNPSNGVLVGPDLTNLGVPTINDANPATKQQIPVPSGGAVPGLLAANGITINGGSLEFEAAVNFTIPASNPIMPLVEVKFNVTNSTEIRVDDPVTGYVIPLPPVITVSVTDA